MQAVLEKHLLFNYNTHVAVTAFQQGTEEEYFPASMRLYGRTIPII